jgi:hypothetical protein
MQAFFTETRTPINKKGLLFSYPIKSYFYMTDWIPELSKHLPGGMDELDLTSMEIGDRLIVKTLHTEYHLTILGNQKAQMQTNRDDRVRGQVQIQGCTFGASSTIKPVTLFCGGNLEYTSNNGSRTHTTSTIRSLHLIRRTLQK